MTSADGSWKPVTMGWISNRRIIATAAGCLLLGVTALVVLLRNTGSHEIHRTHDPVNFPVVDARPAAGDWPWWQGTDQTNTAPFERPPAQWSPGYGNGWVVPADGRGRASLCIWGDQVFVPVSNETYESVSLQSLDHVTGRLLWQTEIHRGVSMPAHPRNALASMAPACDGKHVYMVCPSGGSLWVTAIGMNGRIAWQREAGPYFSRWGYGSSPVIHKSLVIVAADNKGARINRLVGSSYLAAIHRQTGEIVWRIHRAEADSFGTPVVAHIAGRDQLLMAGRDAICAYDPQTGDSLWTCRWPADRVANSVAFDDQHVYASTRMPNPELLCIRADGSGDVTDSHVAWRTNKSSGEYPSPVMFEGKLYMQGDDGVLSCLDPANGQPVWKRLLRGTMSTSPVIAGQHLYCCNEEGTVFVIRLGGRGELVAEVSMNEAIYASPVVSRNRLFLRTLSSLHCIAPIEDIPIVIQPDPPRRRL